MELNKIVPNSPPDASSRVMILAESMTSKNAGHPEPDSYLVAELKSASPHTTHVYSPDS